MAKKGAELEDALQRAAHTQIAFADKGLEKQRFVNAADYSDEWAEGFRAWYICRANQGEGWGSFNTFISSKHWDRFRDDPMATGQRWYCGNCGAR